MSPESAKKPADPAAKYPGLEHEPSAGGHGGRFVGPNGVEVALSLFSMGIDLQGAIQRIRVVVHETEGRPAPTWYWPGRSTVNPVH